jgi:hypothetical protein
MNVEYFQKWRQVVYQKLQRQRALLKNATEEKDKLVYQSNVRYLEGQLDLLIAFIEGKHF